MVAVVEKEQVGPIPLDHRERVGEHVDQSLQRLVLLAQFHSIAVDASQLRHEAGRSIAEPFDETALLLAAKKLGLKAKVINQPAERLDRVALPALALQSDGCAFVVAKIGDGKALSVTSRPRATAERNCARRSPVRARNWKPPVPRLSASGWTDSGG